MVFNKMLSSMQDEFYTFLLSDSADECKERDRIVNIVKVKVLLLKHSLGLSMVGSLI